MIGIRRLLAGMKKTASIFEAACLKNFTVL